MELNIESYQFISRSNIPNCILGTPKTYPVQRPDIMVEIEFSICDKPFEINFTNIKGQRPSIGAIEYIDPIMDKFFSKRWSKCIKGIGKVKCQEEDISDNKTISLILEFLRVVMWDLINYPKCNNIISEIEDQKATTKGYRREYFCGQLIDFKGNRVPNPQERYFSSNIGDYVGPGFVHVLNIDPFKNINELVWSSIIPFRNGLDSKKDALALKEKIEAIRKHYNSYDELEEATGLYKQGNIKSSVRSAASSIDAILRYYCTSWDIKFPKGPLPFNEKIEKILSDATKPSYKKSDPDNLERILYLYRARNSMHEGDCYYDDKSGNRIYIKDLSQVNEFIEAAEKFTIWIDSLV